MVKAARKYGRITQVGTQQRSIELNNQASDLVKEGALGKVHTVLAPNYVGPVRWEPKPPAPMPKDTSPGWWDVWTNQAVMRPYHPQIHYGWAKWWDYDGGGLCFGVTGWGAHSYDQINRALVTDYTGPAEVVLEEPVRVKRSGRFDKPPREDDTGRPYHHMGKNVVGPRAKVRMKFANGTVVKLHLDCDHGPGLGAVFIGEKGWIEINRNMIASRPRSLTKHLKRVLPGEGRGTERHVRNWLLGIASRKKCNADIEIGHRANTLCCLVNIVREVGKVGQPLYWDPEKERFKNSPEGNALLDRERRKGYELPPLV